MVDVFTKEFQVSAMSGLTAEVTTSEYDKDSLLLSLSLYWKQGEIVSHPDSDLREISMVIPKDMSKRCVRNIVPMLLRTLRNRSFLYYADDGMEILKLIRCAIKEDHPCWFSFDTPNGDYALWVLPNGNKRTLVFTRELTYDDGLYDLSGSWSMSIKDLENTKMCIAAIETRWSRLTNSFSED